MQPRELRIHIILQVGLILLSPPSTQGHLNYGGWIPANLSLQTKPEVAAGINQALEQVDASEPEKAYRVGHINSIHTQVVSGMKYKVDVTFVGEGCEVACSKRCDVIVTSRVVNWRAPPGAVGVEVENCVNEHGEKWNVGSQRICLGIIYFKEKLKGSVAPRIYIFKGCAQEWLKLQI